MQVYNTLTRKKETFHPLKDKRVNMFVCGPTVYDYAHIGHARTYIAFDTIARWLKQKGYAVVYLQNITDIDDKIIERAGQASQDPLALAKEFTQTHYADMQALGIESVTKYAPATEYIPQIISQVKRLVEKGFAYKIEGDGYYFDLKKFPDYGKLSGRTVQAAEDATSRIDESINKKNKGDFCLWKFSKEGEPAWDWETGHQKTIGSTPEQFRHGDGRPGWHIEDTAITETEFGPQYDLHGGALELIFPHHEAEIAQMEAISGQAPLVKYWVHTGVLTIGGKKMSKSLGNFITVRDLLKNYSAAALRLLVLSTHYRSPVDYSEDAIKAGAAGAQRIGEFRARLGTLKARPVSFDTIEKIINITKEEFTAAMDDDFNTPRAIAALFKLIREINVQIDNNRVSEAAAQEVLAVLDGFNKTLGITPPPQEITPEEVRQLIDIREKLRRDKRYSEADDVRQQIALKGYRLDDTSNGPLVTKT